MEPRFFKLLSDTDIQVVAYRVFRKNVCNTMDENMYMLVVCTYKYPFLYFQESGLKTCDSRDIIVSDIFVKVHIAFSYIVDHHSDVLEF